MIKVDLSHTVTPIPLEAYIQDVKSIDKKIKERTGLGGDFLGWTTWFKDYDKEEFERIIKAAFEGQNSIRVRDRDSLYNDLTSTVIQTLKDKGYTVEHICSQRDMESWYNISWAK